MSLHILFLLSCLLLSSNASYSQTGPAPPKPTPAKPAAKLTDAPPAPLGTIKGKVTTDDGRVLGNTTVIARAINGPQGMKTAPVDSEGRFTLSDIPAAVYVVFATAPGYLDESMIVAEMNQLPQRFIGSQLNLRLVKGGVITGTVTNFKGEPLVGIPVRATSIHGTGTFMIGPSGIGTAETDDRGVYRIYGLPPGQYTVDTGGGGLLARFVTTGFELDVPTFYPSSTYDTAVPVTVRAGEEATAIDIRYKGTEGHSLSGTITGKVDSAITPAMSVILAYAGTKTPVSTTVVSTTDAARAYSFDGLADGEYDISALLLSGPNANATAGSRRVTVRGTDLTGVDLVMAPLGTITGSIKLDPIAPRGKCDKRGAELMEILIEISREDQKKSKSGVILTMLSPFGSTLNLNGDFSMRHLEPGTYRPIVKLPTEAWYVRSIALPSPASSTALPGQAVRSTVRSGSWPGTITVRPGANISGVSVFVSQDAAGLRGRVVMAPENSPVPQNLQVYLVPSDPDEAQNVLRYFEAVVEADGNFVFTHLPPGHYLLLPRVTTQTAIEEKARPLALDATSRATLKREAEALGQRIELKPCQRAVDVALPVTLSQ